MRQTIIKAMKIVAERQVNVYPKNVTRNELWATVRELLIDESNCSVRFNEEYDKMWEDGSLIKVGHTVNKIPLLKLPNTKMQQMEIIQYNKKGFLLPDSIKSMAAFHAKIMPDGKYLFRVHDCITGIRLTGDLNDPVDIEEAVDKLEILSRAAKEFAEFIQIYYGQAVKPVKQELQTCEM